MQYSIFNFNKNKYCIFSVLRFFSVLFVPKGKEWDCFHLFQYRDNPISLTIGSYAANEY